jgi:hypothetical protein
MKKRIIAITFTILFCMGACSKENKNSRLDNIGSINKITGQINFNENINGDEKKIAVNTNNRSMIAEALGVEENHRNIRFILNSLNTMNAGQIQSAKADEVDGSTVISLVAEDGTDYRIYLSSGGSVEAVQNLITGEWTIQSIK